MYVSHSPFVNLDHAAAAKERPSTRPCRNRAPAARGCDTGHSRIDRGVRSDSSSSDGAAVLICGGSGTGNGTDARCNRAEHAQRSFVPVNCGAMPDTSWSPTIRAHPRAFTARRVGGMFE